MDVKNFKDLKVWRLGKDITLDIYKISKKFPGEELFGLTSQMRRAAVSIPSNIAEGFNRFYKKEYQRYLYYALGSCAELETQTEIASELQYMDSEDKSRLLENINHEARMLKNLINNL